MTVLSAMPCWFYDKRDLRRTPSILDGFSVDRESRYRREGARFIINVGTKMGLRYDTMATGVVYFHRFYMFHSFKTFPRYIAACCCLFLAGKVEETPKKCKDIIKVAKGFINEKQFAQFGDDPKEETMILERILLQTIKFDLQVDHPYGYLLKYAKCLKGEKIKLEKMVQMAWTFINDSLCTTLCLQWEPEVIAIALMHLAGKLSKFEVVDWIGRTSSHMSWWDMYVQGMTIELLEDICHQVLDLYSAPVLENPPDSPPATPPSKSTIRKVKPASPVSIVSSPVPNKPKESSVGQPIPRLEPGELKRKVSKSLTKKEGVDAKIPRLSNSASASQNSASVAPSPKKSTDEREKSRRTPESLEVKKSSTGHFIPTIETAYHTGMSTSSQTSSSTSMMEPIKTIVSKTVAEPVNMPVDKIASNPMHRLPFPPPEAMDNFYADSRQSSVPRPSYAPNPQYVNPPVPLPHEQSLIQPPPPLPRTQYTTDIYRPPPVPPSQPPPLPPPQTQYMPPPVPANIRPINQYPAPVPPLQPPVMPNVSLPPPNMPQLPPQSSVPNVRNEHMHSAISGLTGPPPPHAHGIVPHQNVSPHVPLPPPTHYMPRQETESYGAHDLHGDVDHLSRQRMPMPVRGPAPRRYLRDAPPPPPHHEYSGHGHYERERPPLPHYHQDSDYEHDQSRDHYMEYDEYDSSSNRGPPPNHHYEYDTMMRRPYMDHHVRRNHERPPPPMMLNNRPRMDSPTGIAPVRITGSSYDHYRE